MSPENSTVSECICGYGRECAGLHAVRMPFYSPTKRIFR